MLLLIQIFTWDTEVYARSDSGPSRICPTIEFNQKLPFSLSSDEITLVCGDKKSTDVSSIVWSSIPPSQAKVHLIAMLQIHGYHKSKFEIKNNVLYVDLGRPTIISKISVIGAPANLDIDKKREIRGEKLTPDKLNELQDWVTLEMAHIGFACSTSEIASDYLTGEVQLTVNQGPHVTIAQIDAEKIGDLHDGVIRRFDAFNIGDNYDSWNVSLTERRAIENDFVLGTHFSHRCEEIEAFLHQKIQAGPPRLVQIGAGFDTEEGPKFQLSYHYTRLNQRGSSIQNTIGASYRVQDFTSTFAWYALREPSRFYLKPVFELKRDKENNFEYTEVHLDFLSAYSWDDSFQNWQLTLGPSFQSDHNVVGAGVADSQNLFLKQTLLVTTHGFEYYKSSPQRGYKFEVDNLLSNSAVGSSLTAYQMKLSFENLFNIGDYSPPSLILGWRGSLATTYTPNGGIDRINMPETLKYFIGGTQDVRGFSRQELPANNGLGALTEAYMGFESRFPSILPLGLQPFIFTDGGFLGDEPATLRWPLYWSPGLGIRWASPIGIFRTELANGFVYDPTIALPQSNHSHLQLYLSYGQEF